MAGGHGGSRWHGKAQDEYNIVVGAEPRSHHLESPGAWMPRAHTSVEEAPVYPIASELPATKFPPIMSFHEEDLLPYELLRRRRRLREERLSRILDFPPLRRWSN